MSCFAIAVSLAANAEVVPLSWICQALPESHKRSVVELPPRQSAFCFRHKAAPDKYPALRRLFIASLYERKNR